MTIIETADYSGMSLKAASIIFAHVVLKPNSVLGLATGSTPIGTYENIIRWNHEGQLCFSNTRTVNLDEYKGLSADHDQSYRYFMQSKLFDHIDIKCENTYVPDGLAADPAAECARYDSVIRSMGGIDLQLLGLGHNGHIGFNEPADAFPKGTHLVDFTDSTIKANTRFFASSDLVPRQAFTMGIMSIMQAKSILVVVSGEDKADIVCRAFAGEITPMVPASALQLHPNVTIVGDSAALSKIKKAGAAVCC